MRPWTQVSHVSRVATYPLVALVLIAVGDKASTGAFLINGEPTTRFLAPYAFDKSNAEKLWQFTERLVGEEFRN